MMDDSRYNALDFYIEQDSRHQRTSYRVATHGLFFYLDEVAQTFDVCDLSSGGCCLRAPAESLAVDRILSGDLHIGNASYLTALKLKVVRHIAGGNVACAFQALERRQEFMLDKLLLEIQKRGITIHAARKREEKK